MFLPVSHLKAERYISSVKALTRISYGLWPKHQCYQILKDSQYCYDQVGVLELCGTNCIPQRGRGSRHQVSQLG